MPESCTHLYVHFVWATWDRAPAVSPAMEQPIHACIADECLQLRCRCVAVGGTEDHVHVLVRLRASVSVAEMAKQMKGSSSHLVNHQVAPDANFRWQGTYGAFSVSPDDVDRVVQYINHQREHHRQGTTLPDWERCMEEG